LLHLAAHSAALTLARVAFLLWLIRRWWFWVLLPLVVVVLPVFSLWFAGLVEWQREQAAARAAGLPWSFAEVVAAVPAMDVERQGRLLRWCQNEAFWTFPQWVQGTPVQFLRGELAARFDRRPAQEQADLQRKRGQSLSTLSALLNSGPVVWSQLAWSGDVATRPAEVWQERLRQMERHIRASLVTVADGFAEQAIVGGDLAALRHLDQLVAATRVVGSVHEAFSALWLRRCRDETYLILVRAGRLDAAQVEAWLAEPAEGAVLMARALRIERVTDLLPLTELRTFPDLSWDGTPAALQTCARDAWRNLRRWHQVAQWSRSFRLVAQALTTDGAALDAIMARSWSAAEEDVWRYSRKDLADKASNAVVYDHHQRLTRAAVRAVLAWRAGALPADHTQAEAIMGRDLHANAALLPPLVYEKLSPTRFRLGFATTVPVAARSERDPWRERSAIGMPPSKGVVDLRLMSLELDCAEVAPADQVAPPVRRAP
jgi:hypothetical protein